MKWISNPYVAAVSSPLGLRAGEMGLGFSPGTMVHLLANIAGAFGSYISVESAVVIGMFPDIPRNRFRQVGNAAGMGAKQSLLSGTRRAEAARIGQQIEYLELTVSEKFQGEFIKALYM